MDLFHTHKDLQVDLLNTFSKAKDVVIIPHFNPDGDAIGSALGLYHVLKNTDKSVSVISPNTYPDFLKWLPGNNTILIASENKDKAAELIANTDLIVCVDFSAPDRLGNLEPFVAKSNAIKVLIDHHPDPAPFCDFYAQTTEASSASELVYEVIELLNWNTYFNVDAATCIYTGMMTDTGSFSYSISNSNTFRVAAELISLGIEAYSIYDNVYNNFSFQRMRMLGYALEQKMTVLPEYRAGFITLTEQELIDFKFKIGDTDGFVNYPLSVEGVRLSAIFIEKESMIKISFRSKGNFPVNLFAKQHFNGGGHTNAAGGESYESLTECVNTFVKLLKQYEKDLNQ